MDFEWDENKNGINVEKHGIAFEQAAAVFDDPDQLREPGQLADGELRYQVIGRAEQTSAVLFVAFTLRGSGPGEQTIRIISARRASRAERSRYERI